ncbi:hypothetical protein H6P81_003186 [Aristolochia fimbriata]|uniref:Uncharacterized protein n=1 Tax=Aristolochia fimbriata TaxID=158543 RepID=A0AAV7FC27_ARIFI|nr:hypothetical protein H6P81_003186 [Aristolochia fimbriata]
MLGKAVLSSSSSCPSPSLPPFPAESETNKVARKRPVSVSSQVLSPRAPSIGETSTREERKALMPDSEAASYFTRTWSSIAKQGSNFRWLLSSKVWE